MPAPNLSSHALNRLIAGGWTPDQLPGPRALHHPDYGVVALDDGGQWRFELRGGPRPEEADEPQGPYPDAPTAVAACTAAWRRRARRGPL